MKMRMKVEAGIVAIGLLCAAAQGQAGAESQADLQKQLVALEVRVQRQEDTQAVINLMGLRAFLHGAGYQGKELDLWANREDDAWGMQGGYRIGIKNIRAAYQDRFERVRKQELTQMHKLYPQIEDDPRNLGVGSLDFHTLTTPIIQVAGDGQTAKGLWYTPGIVSGPSSKGEGLVRPSWMWERYAVDFIKEDGKWKFWHVIVLTDFGITVGKSFNDGGATGSNNGVEGSFVHEKPIPLDINRDMYHEYSATTVPHLYPPPPVPYYTFSETFSYGPTIPPINK